MQAKWCRARRQTSTLPLNRRSCASPPLHPPFLCYCTALHCAVRGHMACHNVLSGLSVAIPASQPGVPTDLCPLMRGVTHHTTSCANSATRSYHKRIQFCLNIHNEAVQAMSYPEDMGKEKQESAEERLELLKQVQCSASLRSQLAAQATAVQCRAVHRCVLASRIECSACSCGSRDDALRGVPDTAWCGVVCGAMPTGGGVGQEHCRGGGGRVLAAVGERAEGRLRGPEVLGCVMARLVQRTPLAGSVTAAVCTSSTNVSPCSDICVTVLAVCLLATLHDAARPSRTASHQCKLHHI